MDATDNELLETRYYGCCVVDLYNGHRPHRALDLTPPQPQGCTALESAVCITRRDRLGGVIHEYGRAA
jgi:hypothetical protein